MRSARLLLQLAVYLCMTDTVIVSGNFTLTVKFISYTNPSGLCAECNTRLGDVSLAQIVPVCCDESPLITDSCDNTGEARCDTRFRWIVRTFGSSLGTRPDSNALGKPPSYNFNPCPQSSTTCPFSEMSKTFEQGDLTFLERPNPLPVLSTDPWTGRIQFFIEAVESGLPNITDSFLINLGNLQLGADFTEEMTFTGYHNISYMTMSFKVECTSNYCGPDCTTVYRNDPVFTCQPNSSIVCTNSLRDLSTNCMGCLQGRDPVTNCTQCLPGFNTSTNCTTCLQPGYDPDNDCTQCLPNRDPDTNCTSCLFGNSGDSCNPASSSAPVVGEVVGSLFAVALFTVIVVLVVVMVIMVLKQSKKSVNVTAIAINTSYQHTEPQRSPPPVEPSLDEKTNTGSSTQNERDFQNPIYDTSEIPQTENDYSSPWDSRTAESSEPIIVSSPNSSHAIARRVNSNEPSNGGGKKTSVKHAAHKNEDVPVEYAEINMKGSERHRQENVPLPTTSYHKAVYDSTDVPSHKDATHLSSDYAEPGQAPDPKIRAPTYEYSDIPSPEHRVPSHQVQAYEYNPLPGFSEEQQERVFDNTGESGVYTYSSTTPYANTMPGKVTPEAQQHYDLGNY